jgi:hypothetical protein
MADSSGPPPFTPGSVGGTAEPPHKLAKTTVAPIGTCPSVPPVDKSEEARIRILALRKTGVTDAAKLVPQLNTLGQAMSDSLDYQDRAAALIKADKLPNQTVMCGPNMHTCSVNQTASTAPNIANCPNSAYKVEYPFNVGKLCTALETNHNANFHADQKLAYQYYLAGGSKLPPDTPFPPMGDSRAMCENCQAFFYKLAMKSGQDIVTSDPRGTRVFHADGSVTKILQSQGEYPEMAPNPAWPGDLSKPPLVAEKRTGVFTEYPNGTRKVWKDDFAPMDCPYWEQIGPDKKRAVWSDDGKNKTVFSPNDTSQVFVDGKLFKDSKRVNRVTTSVFYGPDGKPSHCRQVDWSKGCVITESVPAGNGWQVRQIETVESGRDTAKVETKSFENGVEKSVKTETIPNADWTREFKKRDRGEI